MRRLLFCITLMFCLAIGIFAAAAGKTAPGFECTGTEPFWGLTISGSKSMKFSSPEIEKENFVPVSPITIEDGMAYIYNTTSKLTKGAVVVTVIKSSCSDSMSDTEYDYTVVVDRVKEKYGLYGCCRIVK
jgi:uncharacterized membrane protein